MAPNQTALLKQVERLQDLQLNKTCAECYQRDSCWASIIHAPVRGGIEMGVFICGRCYKHHSSLGPKYVVVKSLSMATPWTEEEVKIIERSGNGLVNAIFEAKLPEKDRDTLKEIITTDRKEESEARLEFVTRKYKDLKYFCEKEYKRKSLKLSRAEEEEEDDDEDDPEEKARDRRRSMLLGGSHSMRLPKTREPTTADDNNSANPRTSVVTRSQGVLSRAASRRSMAIRKSNSNRNLMGRLNNIELGSTNHSKKEDKQLENSSTDTAETEDSESSEEQDTALPATYWDDPPTTTTKSPETTDRRQSSPVEQDHAKKKDATADSTRQDSLKGLLSSESYSAGRNLNNLSHIPRRSMSSRNLMQLPSALQLQKSTNMDLQQTPQSRLRKSMSARNLMGRVDQQQASSNEAESGRRELRKSFSSRSMRKSRSIQVPNDLLQKSFSGRSLIGEDGGEKQNSLPISLQGQYNAALSEFDSSLGEGTSNTTKDGTGGLQKSLSSRSVGGRPIAAMRKSFSSRSLQRPNGGLQRQLSGDSLLLGDDSLLGGDDDENSNSPLSLHEQHNASLKEFNSSIKDLRKSFSIKDLQPQNSNRDLRRSLSNKELAAQLSRRNLMRRSASTRDLPMQLPNKGSDWEPPAQVLSTGDQQALHVQDLRQSGPDSGPGSLKKTPSNGSLMRPQMRKSFSGKALVRPNEQLRKSFSGRSLTMNNATDLAIKTPTRKKSLRNVMGSDAGGAPRAGMGKSASVRSLLSPSAIESMEKDQEPDNTNALGMRATPRRSKSMKSLLEAPSGSKGSSHKRESLLEIGDDKPQRDKRSGMRKSMSMRGVVDGSNHSSRMQRTSSRRSLLSDKAGDDPERSKRMQRRSSHRNLSGEGSSHSTRLERSSSRRSLSKGLVGEGSGDSSRLERSSSRRSLSMNFSGEGSTHSKRMERSSSRRSLSMNLTGEGSSHSKRMERSSSRRSLSMNLSGEGSSHTERLNRSSSREQSVHEKDLDANTLCPSRRDMYDPEAKGLALLLQDSSTMSFSCRNGRSESTSPRPRERYASPTRSGQPVDIIHEECDESKRDESRRDNEGQGHRDKTNQLDTDVAKCTDSDRTCERENKTHRSTLIRRIDSKSGLARRSSLSPGPPSSSSNNDAPSESRSHRERRSSVSPRRLSNESCSKSSTKKERRSSRSPPSRDLLSSRSPSSRELRSRRDSLGGSSNSRHSKHHSRRDSLGRSNNSRHSKHHSRKERRDSRSPSRRSSRMERYGGKGGSEDRERSTSDHHHRSNHKDRRYSSSRHSREQSSSRPRDSEGIDYVGFYKDVDRFIESIGCDVNDEDFWWRMIEKWAESA